MEVPRVDVQPIDSSMLEEFRRRILDRESILDDTVELSRPPNDRSSGRGVATSVVASGNSANSSGGLQPIELAEERFILEEDDTSSDSDSNGSEENDEEREEESNGKKLPIKLNLVLKVFIPIMLNYESSQIFEIIFYEIYDTYDTWPSPIYCNWNLHICFSRTLL